MSSEIAVSSELLVAVEVLAHVGLLVRVRSHVRFQVAPLVEDLLANVALVRRTLLVDHLVDGQRSRLAEALLADVALEGLLVRVNETMVAQMVLAPEGLVADVALIGPLVGVCSLVNEEVVGFGELALTESAYEFYIGEGGYRAVWVSMNLHSYSGSYSCSCGAAKVEQRKTVALELTFLWSI